MRRGSIWRAGEAGMSALALLASCATAEAGAPFTATTDGVMTLLVRSDPPNNAVGRFSAGTNAGGAFLYGYPFGAGKAFTTVRVDGFERVFGDQSWGTTTVSVPAPGTVITTWLHTGILVTQTLVLSSYPPGSQSHDGVLITYSAQNNSDAARSIGFRIFLDFKIGAEERVVCAAPGQGALIQGEASWSGNAVPSDVWIHDKFPAPGMSCRWRVSGSGLTTPDTLTVASSLGTGTQRPGLRRSMWAFTPGPLALLQPGGAATFNATTVLNNGGTRTVATFVGMATGAGSSPGNSGDGIGAFPHSSGAYPNPARDRVVLVFPNEAEAEVRVRLHSVDGTMALERRTRERSLALDLTGISPGVYAWTATARGRRVAKGSLAVR